MNEKRYEDGYEESLQLEDRLAILKSRLWTPELNKLLRKWKSQIGIRKEGHIKMSARFNKRHYLLGLPATILTTATSTSTIGTFQDCSIINSTSSGWCDSLEWIRLSVGAVGIIAVILTGILTFMNYQKIAQEHKKAANSYEALFNHIDVILTIPQMLRGCPIEVLKDIRDRYDKIVADAPTLESRHQVGLNFTVAGQQTYTIISNNDTKPANLNPKDVIIDMRDKNTIEKDKNILKRMIDNDTPSHTDQQKEFRNSSTSTELDHEIELRNNFDSDDEDKEVCIGFDIDDISSVSPSAAALALANFNAQRERRVQESLQKGLQFEINRMGGGTPRSSAKTPRQPNHKHKKPPNNYSVSKFNNIPQGLFSKNEYSGHSHNPDSEPIVDNDKINQTPKEEI